MSSIRTHYFEDEQVLKQLIRKDKYIAELRKLHDEHLEIEKKGAVLENKIQKIKEIVQPLAEEYVKEIDLSDVEIVAQIVAEDGKIRCDIYDQVEGYKEQILENKKKKEEEITSKEIKSDVISEEKE